MAGWHASLKARISVTRVEKESSVPMALSGSPWPRCGLCFSPGCDCGNQRNHCARATRFRRGKSPAKVRHNSVKVCWVAPLRAGVRYKTPGPAIATKMVALCMKSLHFSTVEIFLSVYERIRFRRSPPPPASTGEMLADRTFFPADKQHVDPSFPSRPSLNGWMSCTAASLSTEESWLSDSRPE